MSIQTAPCSWPIDYAECSSTLDQISDSGDPQLYEAAAVEYLWNWTGRLFGLCEVTIRPCREDCGERPPTFFGSGVGGSRYGAMWTPVIINGLWFNIGCGVCLRDQCGCSVVPTMVLPGPVDSISRIVIDGETLDPSAYRVDSNRLLVRIDGGTWPLCQDFSKPLTEPGTWAITYERGIAVPVGGQLAAGALACELAKAACGDNTCKLPQRVQTITRQGVTVAMLDSFDDIDKGHTGIWIIDSWVASINKAPKPSTVTSPDARVRSRRTTWSG